MLVGHFENLEKNGMELNEKIWNIRNRELRKKEKITVYFLNFIAL